MRIETSGYEMLRCVVLKGSVRQLILFSVEDLLRSLNDKLVPVTFEKQALIRLTDELLCSVLFMCQSQQLSVLV